jgi:hypothetical protein
MAVRRVRYGADFGPDPDIAPLPLRVRSRHGALKFRCPLYPRKQTFAHAIRMSALGRSLRVGLLAWATGGAASE